MADLSQILKSTPRREPPDTAPVLARARQLRTRRQSAMAAAAVVTIGGLGALLLNLPDGTQVALPASTPSATGQTLSPAATGEPTPVSSASASAVAEANPYHPDELVLWLAHNSITDVTVNEYTAQSTRLEAHLPGGEPILLLWQVDYADPGDPTPSCTGDLVTIDCRATAVAVQYLRDIAEQRYLVTDRVLPDGTRLAIAAAQATWLNDVASLTLTLASDFGTSTDPLAPAPTQPPVAASEPVPQEPPPPYEPVPPVQDDITDFDGG